MQVASEEFRQAMRRLPAAVALITTTFDGAPCGLTATAVCSLSAAPPSLLVCVNAGAGAHDAIKAAGTFAVNLLAAGDVDLARLFSSSAEADRLRRFSSPRWRPGALGAPLLDAAVASFDCRVETDLSHATHTIFIGAVMAVATAPADVRNLIYADGQFASIPADQAG
jgi:flavin reductase (DIM6/NTAB) family NADH-FMN oxidoreductase RutF